MMSGSVPRVYLRVPPLVLQNRIVELRARQARLREEIEEYLRAAGRPLRPGAFEDHTELLGALATGPAHLAAERMRIAIGIAALVHGLHEALQEATPVPEEDLAAVRREVFTVPDLEGHAARALAEVRQLLVRWANRWSQYQSSLQGPPA